MHHGDEPDWQHVFLLQLAAVLPQPLRTALHALASPFPDGTLLALMPETIAIH